MFVLISSLCEDRKCSWTLSRAMLLFPIIRPLSCLEEVLSVSCHPCDWLECSLGVFPRICFFLPLILSPLLPLIQSEVICVSGSSTNMLKFASNIPWVVPQMPWTKQSLVDPKNQSHLQHVVSKNFVWQSYVPRNKILTFKQFGSAVR